MSIKVSRNAVTGNGGDGVKLGGGGNTNFEIHECWITGNHGGGINVNVSDKTDVEIADCTIANNIGHGIEIVSNEAIMQKLGLPVDTNPASLAELLSAIIATSKGNEPAVIKDSGLWGTVSSFVTDSTTVIANIIAMANDENVKEMIRKLMG